MVIGNSLRRHYPDQVLRVEDLSPPLSLSRQAPRFNCVVLSILERFADVNINGLCVSIPLSVEAGEGCLQKAARGNPPSNG